MTWRYSRYIPLFYYLGQTPQFSKLIQNIRRLSMTNGDLESTPDPFINILHFHPQAGSFFPKGFDAPGPGEFFPFPSPKPGLSKLYSYSLDRCQFVTIVTS